jgi:poly(3-hydroxybutyrate) depolymerase
MMANRLACERPDRFAAVALVAGTGPAQAVATCSTTGHVSVIAFNGTDDPLIPYNDGVDRAVPPGRRRWPYVARRPAVLAKAGRRQHR